MIAAISSYLFCTEILFNFLYGQMLRGDEIIRKKHLSGMVTTKQTKYNIAPGAVSNRCRKGENANGLSTALAGRTITQRNVVLSIYIIAVQRLQFAGSKSFAFFSFVIT